ncbi:MAG: hypothetical protein Q9192_003133 [Flavoplaca navasiana]
MKRVTMDKSWVRLSALSPKRQARLEEEGLSRHTAIPTCLSSPPTAVLILIIKASSCRQRAGPHRRRRRPKDVSWKILDSPRRHRSSVYGITLLTSDSPEAHVANSIAFSDCNYRDQLLALFVHLSLLHFVAITFFWLRISIGPLQLRMRRLPHSSNKIPPSSCSDADAETLRTLREMNEAFQGSVQGLMQFQRDLYQRQLQGLQESQKTLCDTYQSFVNALNHTSRRDIDHKTLEASRVEMALETIPERSVLHSGGLQRQSRARKPYSESPQVAPLGMPLGLKKHDHQVAGDSSGSSSPCDKVFETQSGHKEPYSTLAPNTPNAVSTAWSDTLVDDHTEDISNDISSPSPKTLSPGSDSHVPIPAAVEGNPSPEKTIRERLKQVINDSIHFFEQHDGKPIVAKGVVGTPDLFRAFHEKGYYSTKVMLLLIATTSIPIDIALHLDDGCIKHINQNRTALVSSIIIVSFDGPLDGVTVGHWIVVHADLIGKIVTIFDSMATNAHPVLREDDLPNAYLRPITLIRNLFPEVIASKTDRNFSLRIPPSESIPALRLRHCQQAFEAFHRYGSQVAPATPDELEILVPEVFDNSNRNRKRSSSKTTISPLPMKMIRKSPPSASMTSHRARPDYTNADTHGINQVLGSLSDEDDSDSLFVDSSNGNIDDDEHPVLENDDKSVRKNTAIDKVPQNFLSNLGFRAHWTPEEDKILLFHKTAGLSIRDIADLFQFRTYNSVKARLMSLKSQKMQEPMRPDKFRARSSRGNTQHLYTLTLWSVQSRTNWELYQNRQHCVVNFNKVPEGVSGPRSPHAREPRNVDEVASSTQQRLEKMTVNGKTIAMNTTMKLVAVGAHCPSKWLNNNFPTWQFEGADTELSNLPSPWVEPHEAIRLLGLANVIKDKVENFLKFDMYGHERGIYKDILRPFKDDDNLWMCGFCDQGFAHDQKDKYYQHAAAHSRGAIHVTSCCLQPYTKTHGPSKQHEPTNPFCCPHPEVQHHGPFTNLMEQMASKIVSSSWVPEIVNHKWDIVALSVRYSSVNFAPHVEAKLKELRTRYETGFKAKVTQWIGLPLRAHGRSSCEPPWTYPEWQWGGKGHNQIENTAVHIRSQISKGTRLLFLCLGIDGLSTNLQWLMHLATDFAPAVTTLGICTSKKIKSRELERQSKQGMNWSFYELEKLRNVMRGDCQDARYERLILILYCIQKAKLGKSTAYVGLGGGRGRMAFTDDTQATLLDDYGVVEMDEDGELSELCSIDVIGRSSPGQTEFQSHLYTQVSAQKFAGPLSKAGQSEMLSKIPQTAIGNATCVSQSTSSGVLMTSGQEFLQALDVARMAYFFRGYKWQSSSASFPLLDLAPEIRDEIYALVVVHNGYINPCHWVGRVRPKAAFVAQLPATSDFKYGQVYYGDKGSIEVNVATCQDLFYVSKEVSVAARRIFYQRNKFFYFCSQDFLEIPGMLSDYTPYLRTIGICITELGSKAVAGLLKMGRFSQLKHLILYISFRPRFEEKSAIQELLTLRNIAKVEVFEMERQIGVGRADIDRFKHLLELNTKESVNPTA